MKPVSTNSIAKAARYAGKAAVTTKKITPPMPRYAAPKTSKAPYSVNQKMLSGAYKAAEKAGKLGVGFGGEDTRKPISVTKGAVKRY
jgi:hypothetical protein